MPRQAQYALAGSDQPRTMVNDLMDLDEVEPHRNPSFTKFLRTNIPARNRGVMGQDPLEHISTRGPPMMTDPRMGTQYPSGPPLNPNPIHPKNIAEPFTEDKKRMAKLVLNRIFENASNFAEALDNEKDSLHRVARSFLGTGVSCADKTVYITIIAIMAIAIICLLYRAFK
jgi:hypothetical protein